MLKIGNVEVFGLEGAVRGVRNPKNSWSKSDSGWKDNLLLGTSEYKLGENDLKLMSTLSKAGNDHGKFMRMIHVQLDITAPLYWWKEFDTYKIGTVSDSCSTMHKIQAKEFERDDFSHEHLDDEGLELLDETIKYLNKNRDIFNHKDNEKSPNRKDFWWNMIQALPSAYNQRRTIDLNYAVLKSMYFARKDHKLDEWHTLTHWIEMLPYAKELILGEF